MVVNTGNFKDLVISYLLAETIVYKRGHKNSRGEDCPWVIISEKDGRILGSYATKELAQKALQRMHYPWKKYKK